MLAWPDGRWLVPPRDPPDDSVPPAVGDWPTALATRRIFTIRSPHGMQHRIPPIDNRLSTTRLAATRKIGNESDNFFPPNWPQVPWGPKLLDPASGLLQPLPGLSRGLPGAHPAVQYSFHQVNTKQHRDLPSIVLHRAGVFALGLPFCVHLVSRLIVSDKSSWSGRSMAGCSRWEAGRRFTTTVAGRMVDRPGALSLEDAIRWHQL